MKVYCVSGLGGNHRAFDYIQLAEKYELCFIGWELPFQGEALQDYAFRMTRNINTDEPFILIGFSFGGIIVQEMNRHITPLKTIVISCIKNRKEFPKLFRFASKTNIHRIIPMFFFTNDKLLSYAFFRKFYYRKKRPTFNDFFTYRNPHYLKWSINCIVNWRPTIDVPNLFRIHGMNDIVFPHRKLEGEVQLIKKGTHIMIIQKPKQVSKALNQVLA